MTPRKDGHRIGLLADTHLDSRRLPPWRWWDRWLTSRTDRQRLLDVLAERWGAVDEVWHGGDVGDPTLLDDLERRMACPVRVVRGHADGGRRARGWPALLDGEIDGVRWAMVHGAGTPRYLIDRIMHAIGWSWDLVVYGHTHRPIVRRREGVLFVNPGSPTDHRFTPFRSVAVVEIREGRPDAQLIDLEPDLTRDDRPLE